MKGISLPINAIVIVAIAVLVLVVIAAFFGGFFSGFVLNMQREDALSKACQNWKLYDCDYGRIDDATTMHKEPGDDAARAYTVEELCELMGISTELDNTDDSPCKRKCGCPIIS